MSMTAEETIRRWTPEFWKRAQFAKQTLPVPQERFERFASLPSFLLEMWHRVGFGHLANGHLYLTDPLEWQPVVDAWMANGDPGIEDDWVCVARTPFGDLELWGAHHGMALTITQVHGSAIPLSRADEMASDADRSLQVLNDWDIAIDDVADFEDAQNRPLFQRCVKRLGVPGAGEMFGFVPALALGGPESLENVEVVDALTHSMLLTELTKLDVPDIWG